LFALNQVERFDLLYMPPPGMTEPGPAAILAAELYCRRRGAMLVLDPPAPRTSAAAALCGIRQAAYASPNPLAYSPRSYCGLEAAAPPRVVGGALAGLLCRLDRNHGPWGSLDQPELALRRDLKPAVDIEDDEARQLAREGLNVIVGKPGRAVTVQGSVTLARN